MSRRTQRLANWIVLIAAVISGLQDFRQLFSKDASAAFDWIAFRNFVVLVAAVSGYQIIRKYVRNTRIQRIAMIFVIGFVVFSFLSSPPPCTADHACDENEIDIPPVQIPGHEIPDIVITASPTQEPQFTPAQSPSTEATATSPDVANGELPGPTVDAPTPVTPLPGATCKPLETLFIEGLTDWLYTVKVGDTLFEIARYFLGDGSRWRDIYARNLESFGDLPSDGTLPKIYPGQQIIIPNVMSPRYITVEPDDTLSNLGGKVYGDDSSGRFWCAIFLQNQDRIGDNPNYIQAGQVFIAYPLAIPSEAEVLVPPDSTFAGLVTAYYGELVDVQSICLLQRQQFGEMCKDVLPFDMLFFPGLPPLQKFRVGPGENLEAIVARCFGEATEQLMIFAKTVNQKVIGYDPTFIHVGQVLTLYGCKL